MHYCRFHKLVWSNSGVLIGGCDNGLIQFYSIENMLKGQNPLIAANEKHTGLIQ